MNKPFLALLALSVTFLLTPALVLAQYSSNQIVDFIWVRTFGFERQWLNNPNQLILNALLPAVAIYAIFLGMMRVIRISYGMGNIEHLIAVVVMLAALFTGGIGYISGLLAFLGNFSFVLFFILFIIGALLYSWGYLRNRWNAVNQLANSARRAEDYYHRELDMLSKKAAHEYEEADRHPEGSRERKEHMKKAILHEAKRKEAVSGLKMMEEGFFSLPGGVEMPAKKKRPHAGVA